MCGIFGYYNYDVARDRATILSFLINGLRRLEYRGYDSSGICIDGTDGRPDIICNGSTTEDDHSKLNGSFPKTIADPYMLVWYEFRHFLVSGSQKLPCLDATCALSQGHKPKIFKTRLKRTAQYSML